MKRICIFFALMTVIGIFAACEKEGEKEDVRPTSGVWVEQLLPDGAERVLTFKDGANSVGYSVTYFNPDISKEEIQVPFFFDKSSDGLQISFSGIENKMSISEIVINPTENQKHWYGIMKYSDAGKMADTLYFSYAGLSFNEDIPEEVLSIEFPSDKDSGPQAYANELPWIGWVNPIAPMNYPDLLEDKPNESILSFAGKQILSAAGKQIGTMLFNVAWDALFPSSDPMAENIKSIMQDINIIKKQLEIIEKQLEEIKKELIRKDLKARNSAYIALSSSVSNIMMNIEGAIEGNKDNPEAASAAIEKLILEWGKETVNGNPIYLAVQNYVSMSIDIDYPYPALYDSYAYETFAWESDGYEWREMLRTTDEALVSSASAMTVLYWVARNRTEPTVITDVTLKNQIDKQVELLKTMDESYSKNPVVRHPDYMICQISGLHRVFDRNMEWRDLEHPDWYPNTLGMWLSATWLVFGTGQFSEKSECTCKDRFMTENEYDKLIQYYSGEDISLLSLFKKIGFSNILSEDLDSPEACMLLPAQAWDIPAGDMIFYGITVDKPVLSKGRKKLDYLSIGVVRTENVPVKDPDDPLERTHYERRFVEYVKYGNHTWFNLRVLKRD